MRKTTKKSITRIISFLLVSIMLLGSVVPIFANNTDSEAYGIVSGQTYMLKNKESGRYLTLPGYFEYTSGKTNVYQDIATINDQYSRAVRVTYNESKKTYTIVPLLYETFGENYLVALGSGNVVISSLDKINPLTDTHTWTIEYIDESNAYKLSCDGKYLNAMGLSNGSVDETGVNSSGNIVVKDSSANYWIFEPVTVNPHIFKSNSVTKKNIGIDNEWLFKLSDTEMEDDNCVITSTPTVSGNANLVQVVRYGKYVVVRVKDDGDGDKSNDFAIITITVNNSQTRTVVVQNAGTGHGDACTTKPFKGLTPLYTVVIEQNEISPDGVVNKEVMLTFSSSLGNFVAESWKSTDSCVTFAEYDGKQMVGSNFAIVKINNAGLAQIIASDDEISPTFSQAMIFDVQIRNVEKEEKDVIDLDEYSFSWNETSENPAPRITLKPNREYVLKSKSTITSSDWYVITGAELCEILVYSGDFIYIHTYSRDYCPPETTYAKLMTFNGPLYLDIDNECYGLHEFSNATNYTYIGVGETIKLVPDYVAYDYVSTDSNVVTVDKLGYVTGMSMGTATITAKAKYGASDTYYEIDIQVDETLFYSNYYNDKCVYKISDTDNEYYWVLSEAPSNQEQILGLVPSQLSGDGTILSTAWRFEAVQWNSNYYRIFSMSADSEDRPLAYNGSRIIFSDTTEILDEQLWFIRRYGDYVYFSPKSEPDKFFTRTGAQIASMRELDMEDSAWTINEFAYSSHWGDSIPANMDTDEDGKYKIYCVVDTNNWDETILQICDEENPNNTNTLEYVVSQWNNIANVTLELVKFPEDEWTWDYNKYYIKLTTAEQHPNVKEVLGKFDPYDSNNNLCALNPSQWSFGQVTLYSNPASDDGFYDISIEERKCTLFHELGHALGLAHPDENKEDGDLYLSVMQGFTDYAGATDYITNFDKMALMAKWGD